MAPQVLRQSPRRQGTMLPSQSGQVPGTYTYIHTYIHTALMTLDQKIGQMTQAINYKIAENASDLATYHIGSMLSGGGGGPGGKSGGSAAEWQAMIDGFQREALKSELKIPILYGVDAVHGHNNVYGATLFPHNIGLGATRDPQLVKKIAETTVKEVRSTGAHWDFSPCIAVPRDDRWGRTYEGFSEDPSLVALLGKHAIMGYQGASKGINPGKGLLATAKHYVGDGGTVWGTGSGAGSADAFFSIDQGDVQASEEAIRKTHLAPYLSAIEAGVGSIMVSFSSIDGVKMHGNKKWVTDILKGELRFKGFIISDYAGIDQIDPTDYPKCVRTAINAGVDMVMVPEKYKEFIATLKAEVEAGRVPLSRIDDAVLRILKVKKEMKLWDHPLSDPSLLRSVGSPSHRALAREAVAKSVVLLKRDPADKLGGTKYFPLPKSGAYKIMVAGKSANDIGIQSGGWTITWQGSAGNTTKGTTILEGIRRATAPQKRIAVDYARDDAGLAALGEWQADYGIAVVGEMPYTEGFGDSATLGLPSEDVAVIDALCAKVKKACIVVVVSGRPIIITEQLPKAQVWAAAWLPGTQGEGVADVLFGFKKFVGKLPVTWPRAVTDEPTNFDDATDGNALFKIGHGLK